MSLIKKIYRAVIPETLRWKIINSKRKKEENAIKSLILTYYNNHPTKDLEINEALSYLQMNDLSVFPYDFFNQYKTKDIKVLIDETNQMPYVIHFNKKLYFKKSWTENHIVDAYRFLLAEQDIKSAHCYLNTDYAIKDNAVVVDVGAAEGIFVVSDIERIQHVYLIETDPEWIEALNETYKPWSDKITIINKFISDKDDEHNLRLDTYFKNDEQIDFLKIDVDGAEQDLINGAQKTISDKVDMLAICTYHKTNDNKDFSELLLSKNYRIENSNGYMLFYFDSGFEAPYFRRGLIKAKKNI
ncbi:MAG: FkbM family methyltransferase [Burkholderiales bacterium]|nr:FkbM family methyltransferase [Bacteroidia bacterium]